MSCASPTFRLAARIGSFARDERAAAAIEFAFIAPLMIGMYLATAEITQAVDTQRKVNRLASTVADLITQETKTDPAELQSILAIGSQVLQPYRRTAPGVRAEGIQVTDSGAKLVWAATFENGRFTMASVGKNAAASVPPEFNVAGTFVVKAVATLDYRPMLSWTAEQRAGLGLFGLFDSLAMGETIYLRPRVSTDVKCIGC